MEIITVTPSCDCLEKDETIQDYKEKREDGKLTVLQKHRCSKCKKIWYSYLVDDPCKGL